MLSSQGSGFLTDAQRATLDAALQAKQESGAARAAAPSSARSGSGSGGGHAASGGPSAAHAGDRRPRGLKGSGAAKKGGGGGKFTWGRAGGIDDGSLGAAGGPLDANDPNYDSEEDAAVVLQSAASRRLREEVAQYKAAIRAVCEEYFSSGDVQDVADSLEELGAAGSMAHYFVKRLVTLALDRRDREREMASALLSSLYAEVISPDQMAKGFRYLAEALDDTLLDVPDGVELLARFIARGVVDDILPPSAPAKWTEGAPAGSALAALRARADAHLAGRHAGERMLRCWGAGAGQSHAETKERLARLLAEYLDSRDAAEASRCLRQLGVPYFHHELVKLAVHAALDGPQAAPAVVDLLTRLSGTGEVSPTQLAKGLQRVADGLADARLDNPAAPARWAETLAALEAAGLVDAESVTSLRAASAAAAAADARPASASGGGAGGAALSSSSPGGGVGAGASGGVGGAGVPAFKAAAAAALREYFESADAREVAARLAEADEPGLHPLFVKAAVAMAMDRRDRERELVSRLLAALPQEGALAADAVAAGFTRLLAAVDDLVLDVPDAPRLLALFLGRAVVDEVLPPAFLASALPSLPDDGLGVGVVRAAGTLLSARHAAERLAGCWRGGGAAGDEGLAGVRRQLRDAAAEYLETGSVEEVAQVLRDTGLPHYGHELVKEALELAFERPPPAVERVGTLLAGLARSGALSSTQLAMGLARVRARLDDDALDAPQAPAAFAALLDAGTAAGWLPAAEYGELVAAREAADAANGGGGA